MEVSRICEEEFPQLKKVKKAIGWYPSKNLDDILQSVVDSKKLDPNN